MPSFTGHGAGEWRIRRAIERTLYLEFREPGFAPAPRLEHLVTAGYLGRKTGRGFRVS